MTERGTLGTVDRRRWERFVEKKEILGRLRTYALGHSRRAPIWQRMKGLTFACQSYRQSFTRTRKLWNLLVKEAKTEGYVRGKTI